MRSLILPDSKPRVTIQNAANLVECRATRIQVHHRPRLVAPGPPFLSRAGI